MPDHDQRAAAGFTLLEVLVALVIFGLLFGVLAQIYQTGLRQSERAESVTVATLLARSQLARIGVDLPVEIGVHEDDVGDGFRLRTEIAPADIKIGDNDLVPYEVEVTVAWGPGERAQAVTLTTLRVGPRPE